MTCPKRMLLNHQNQWIQSSVSHSSQCEALATVTSCSVVLGNQMILLHLAPRGLQISVNSCSFHCVQKGKELSPQNEIDLEDPFGIRTSTNYGRARGKGASLLLGE
jgi:hypothetical protein